MEWVPLSARDEPADFDNGPYEGDPAHAVHALAQWVDKIIIDKNSSDWYRDDLLMVLETRLRLPLGHSGPIARGDRLQQLMMSDEVRLNVIDFLIGRDAMNPRGIETLGAIMGTSGMVWQPVPANEGVDRWHLERRVGSEATAAFEKAMSSSKLAAGYLAKAWVNVYGRTPDASVSYSNSVKAVEVAAHLPVLPTNKLATLGQMRASIEQGASKWRAPLGDQDAVETLVAMMTQLYRGQFDRHGSALEQKEVSPADAEAALHLAITLTHWFGAGLVGKQA